ncbi:MAG: hypothetical protein ACKVU1_09185 [bacterium]
MESLKDCNRSKGSTRRRTKLAALLASALLYSVAMAAQAVAGVSAGAPPAGEFVRTDEAERLVLALESAQTELEHAALAREEIETMRAANNPVRIAQAWLAAAASNTPLLAGAGVAGGVLIGMAIVTGARGISAKPRKRPIARRGAVAAAPIDPPAPPRADSVVLSVAASRDREGDAENVWAKILRLSSTGMSGEEISRALGASADDINLVLGLQRRRMEVAGALSQSGVGRVKTAGR